MSDLMGHAAVYLETLNMVEPLLDRFIEDCPGLAEAVEQYYAFSQGGEFLSGGALDGLLAATAHTATQGAMASMWAPDEPTDLRDVARFSRVVVEQNQWAQPAPKLSERLPAYYGLPALRGGLQWWVRRSIRVGPADGRHHWRRLRDRRIPAAQVVEELRAVGGMSNVFHAVMGAHYFAVRTRPTEFSPA